MQIGCETCTPEARDDNANAGPARIGISCARLAPGRSPGQRSLALAQLAGDRASDRDGRAPPVSSLRASRTSASAARARIGASTSRSRTSSIRSSCVCRSASTAAHELGLVGLRRAGAAWRRSAAPQRATAAEQARTGVARSRRGDCATRAAAASRPATAAATVCGASDRQWRRRPAGRRRQRHRDRRGRLRCWPPASARCWCRPAPASATAAGAASARARSGSTTSVSRSGRIAGFGPRHHLGQRRNRSTAAAGRCSFAASASCFLIS